MKKILVVANTKGGVGKTTISDHLLPFLFPSCEILEIDDNNSSNVFANSKLIHKFESITVKDAESKFLEDIVFRLLDDTEQVLVIDCGGGNDTRKVIQQIMQLDLGAFAEVTYIVPLMNSLNQAKNAVDMQELLKGRNVVYVLNNVANMNTIKEDWVFWYGNQDLDIEGYYSILDKPKTLYVPASPYFELSTLYNETIGDFAQLAYAFNRIDYQKMIFQKCKGDKDLFAKEMRSYRPRELAKDFLNSFAETFKNELEG